MPAGRALQQLHAEPALELGDTSADHRLGQPELVSGTTESLLIDYRDEGFEFFETAHIVLFLAIIIFILRYL